MRPGEVFVFKTKGAGFFAPRISTEAIDTNTIQAWMREPMTLVEWTEVFRLAEQRFIRQKRLPGETAKMSQSDLEKDKIQSAEALLYKPPKYFKKEASDPSERYMSKFYAGSPQTQ